MSLLVGQVAQPLVQATGLVIGGGASLPARVYDVSTAVRLTAVFHLQPGEAAAAGYPRIVQSFDGVADDVITELTQDATQLPEVVYTGTVSLVAPFVKPEFTDGGAGCTLSYFVAARPA